MAIRGLRGATSVKANTKDDILTETRRLLQMLCDKNELDLDDIASIFFSVTDDLNAEFPAVAAREMGFVYTPLFCMKEIPVTGSLPLCIRILIHVNTEKSQKDMIPIYMNAAESLRPDASKVGHGS